MEIIKTIKDVSSDYVSRGGQFVKTFAKPGGAGNLGGNFKSLRFPENVGTDEVPVYIRFVPQEVRYGGTEGLNPAQRPALKYGSANSVGGSAAGASIDGAINQVKSQIGGAVESFASAAKQSISGISSIFKGTSFSSVTNDLGRLVSGKVNFGLFSVNLGQKTNADTITSLGSINLYMPEGLSTGSSVKYAQIETGAAGALMSSKGISEIDKGTIEDVVKGVVINKAAKAMSAEMKAVAAAKTGKVLNNFSFQVFDGVDYRSFKYEFRMVAKNERESLEIKNICDTFLFLMLPGRSAASGPQFYEIPCQWSIEYHRLGDKIKYFQQPGPCFLTNVDVTYNGDTGNNTYNDGAPMSVTLSLSFTEIEPMYRGNSAL
jgi:hypothetical protein